MIRFVTISWQRYALSLIALGGGTLAAVTIQHFSGGRAPFIIFFPLVTIVAALAGVGPGLICTALSSLMVAMLWMEPYESPRVHSPGDRFTLALYVLAGTLTSFVGGALRRSQLERRESQLSLKTAEERLRLAIQAVRMGTWEWTLPTGRVVWSAGLEEIHGRPAGSFKGTFEDVLSDIYAEDRQRFISTVQKAVEDRGDYQIEYRIVFPDGSLRWLEGRGKLYTDDAGQAERMVGICMDITDRRRVEQAVQESEARFRALADGAPVPISVSREGRHLYVNAAYRQCFGLAPEMDLVGSSILDQIAPEDRPRIQQKIRSRYAGEAVDAEYEFTGVRSDGARLTMEVRIGQINLADGAASMAFLTDVTQRQRALRELAESELRFRNTADSVVLLADAGKLLTNSLEYEKALSELARLVVPRLADWCAVDMLESNNALRRVAVVHPDPEKVELAHSLHRRYPPDPSSRGGAWEVIRSRRTSCVPEITDEMLVASARDEAHLQIMRALKLSSFIGVPLVARGRVLGILTLIYAESGRRYLPADVALAEELARRAAIAVDNALLFEAERSARAEAERASRSKDEFLATMSHELRTPLNAILGWSQILASNGAARDPEDLEEGLKTIERNARAQTQLIEDLLDMSRVVTGKLRLDMQTVVPVGVVTAALESIRPAAEAKSIRVEKVLDPSAGPIAGDPGRLQQAVWNLLTNAVKFTPAGGKINVLLERVNSHVQLSVSDNGPGIKPEFLPHIFERFRQADASTTRRHGGLGIGLALVKQLIELHGGNVRAQSPGEGKGSTFIIELPVSLSRMNSADVTSTAEHMMHWPARFEPDLDGLTVLVVDDEPDARALVRRILEERGAAVTAAASAKEAIEVLRARQLDVVLSDIGMAENDGYEFISWVRGMPAEKGGLTPAAALTAFARSEDRQRALIAGFQSHIAKPVEPSELITLVAQQNSRSADKGTRRERGNDVRET
jgi:PAS domain S-box-containing protein